MLTREQSFITNINITNRNFGQYVILLVLFNTLHKHHKQFETCVAFNTISIDVRRKLSNRKYIFFALVSTSFILWYSTVFIVIDTYMYYYFVSPFLKYSLWLLNFSYAYSVILQSEYFCYVYCCPSKLLEF